MASGPNKIARFWQELKRRKVIQVIIVYATAAFVIIELVDIITEPLRCAALCWFYHCAYPILDL